MEENNNSIRLSVLETEKKYRNLIYEEPSGGKHSYVAWGIDNNLPKLYLNCYNGSSTLKSVIDGTINYILGDEVMVNPETAGLWLKTVNRTGMNMRELIEAISYNYLVYGGFGYQVIYNKLLLPVEIYPLDYSRLRINEDMTKIYYAKKWGKYQAKFDEYDAFNPDNVDPEKLTQIFYYKPRKTQSIYPLPMWNGALYDILTEIECSKYSLNTVANGFNARYVFQFPETNNLTDEQKKGMQDAIKEKFCGNDNLYNYMLYWKNDEKGIEVNKIESDDTSEKYIAIKDSARQNIFVAMRATPTLFGLPNATNGFSTGEFSDSFKIFQKTVVMPIQDIIIENIEKTIGCEDAIKIKPFTITFENV